MAIICVASLKGGVGKTSVALNVARACSRRNAKVLLVDLDPAAHAGNLVSKVKSGAGQGDSPLVSFLKHPKLRSAIESCGSVLGAAERLGISLAISADLSFEVLHGGSALEALVRSGQEKVIKNLLTHLLSELDGEYDYVFIDTEPSFSALTAAALESASVALVPVDSSVMSIWGLEQLLERSKDLKHLTWCIARNMFSRQSSRLQRMATERLEGSVPVQAGIPDFGRELEEEASVTFDTFVDMVSEYETNKKGPNVIGSAASLYLLDTIIYRSDLLNRLTHEGLTVFESRAAAPVAEQYLALSREIERVVALAEQEDLSLDIPDDANPYLAVGGR